MDGCPSPGFYFSNLFLKSIKQSSQTEDYIDYQDFSIFTLAWLAFKQHKYKEVIDIIHKYERKIDSEKENKRK